MVQRAYSVLEIKSVDEEQRILEGIATTPSTDRYGDIVEAAGAEFTLPVPFLWQHRHDSPIGHVIDAKVEGDGIRVRVQIAQDDEPGPLRDLLNLAWSSIKKKLVRGLSIGFMPLESTDIEGSWAKRFIRWDWMELSAVTIPANAEATITSVKSFAQSRPASSGKAVRLISPGASGTPTPRNPMNTSEQISGLEATRASKAARMDAIQKAATDAGTTKDEAQREEFDTLKDEIKSLDVEIADLRDLEAINKSAATPVKGTSTETASASRAGLRVVAQEKQLPPGLRLARVVRAIGLAHKSNRDVEMVARSLFPDDALIAKAAIAAGTTAHATWAGPLVGDESSIFADFVEFLRPQTIIGKFGTGGVPSLRRVPFRTRLISQTSGGAGYWVGEGKAKGLTKFDFAGTTLEPMKVANIAVLTEELLRDSSPSAELVVRDQLAAALRARLDTDFIDPTFGGSGVISPASITNGAVAIPSAGNTSADVRADIMAVFNAFIAADNAPTTGVWIMPATRALALSLMQNPLGQPEFPGININGGTLFGLPVIVSEYVPTDSGGSYVVLVNAQDIYLGDDGDIAIDVSREASLQMDSEPTQHVDGTPTATQMVSLWQTNAVGFRAERTISWKTRRAEAVQLLSDVNWGQPES
jgi:HK97 family phage prohead protease